MRQSDSVSLNVNTKFTLDNCEDEPIHRPESIQSYGCLLAFDLKTRAIKVISDNLNLFLAVEKNVILKSRIDDINLSKADIKHIEEAIKKVIENSGRVGVVLDLANIQTNTQQKKTYHAIVYLSDNLAVIEIENTQLNQDDTFSNIARINATRDVADIGAYEDIASLATAMTTSIKAFTGYDRVMMYRFDKDYNGKVIAESKEKHLEPFLGLNYPASDIPAQARRLYEINWIRMIEDVDGVSSSLQPAIEDAKRAPLDMSHSMLRSVSPFHIEYLKNMGVQATMSISIMQGEKLWGLIACHHYSKKYVPQNVRLECESIGQFFSWQLQAKEQNLALQDSNKANNLIDRIIFGFREHEKNTTSLNDIDQPLLELMQACGFILFLGNEVHEAGLVPSRAICKYLVKCFNKKSSRGIQFSSQLKRDFPDTLLSSSPEGIAGALYVPLSPVNDYFALWFRKEKTKVVNWAGAPDTKSTAEENRLSPRGSFALWKQTVKHTCEEWTLADIKTAERFNKLFVAHVIDRKIDLESNIKKLQALDRAKDEFLANISHELRTPLNVIIGWTDLAMTVPDNYDQVMEAVKVIRRSALTQSELINDLLDISRIISGTLKLSVKNVNLASIIDDVHESFLTAATTKNITISKTLSNDDQTILGDPVRIKQILWNLISNAIKFSEKNGKISITSRKDHSNYIIEVSDNGIGLTREAMSTIFDRFSQVEKKHGKKGMGIGLSICKYLVDMHGGHIEVESKGRGEGASFKVTFPVSPISASDENESAYLQQQGSIQLNKHTGRLSNMHILIAEDDPDAATFISQILKIQGATVEVAANGIEAISCIEQSSKSFDLLISDIGMPEMDGYELIKEIRQRKGKKYKGFCAIALTAYAYTSDRIKSLKAGFDSYVTKPVDLEELLTVIESTCGL